MTAVLKITSLLPFILMAIGTRINQSVRWLKQRRTPAEQRFDSRQGAKDTLFLFSKIPDRSGTHRISNAMGTRGSFPEGNVTTP